MNVFKIIENFIFEFRKVMEDPSIKISRDHTLIFACRANFEVVVKFSPKSYAMCMFAPIRTVKDLNKTQGLNLMMNCMAANHFYTSTRGATLSYSTDEQLIVLNYSHPIKHSNGKELVGVLAAFCDTAEIIRKWSASDSALLPHGDKEIKMPPFNS